MKNSFIALSILFLIIGCKKEVESTPTPTPTTTPQNIFKFDLDGSHKDLSNEVTNAGIFLNQLSIIGSENNGSTTQNMSVSIILHGPSESVFDLQSGSSEVDYIGLIIPNGSGQQQDVFMSNFVELPLNPGNVNITSIDYVNNRIKGTFNTYVSTSSVLGTLQSHEITNGVFDLPFTH